MDTPWEHELERALVSQLAEGPTLVGRRPVTDDGGGGEDVESAESDADARDDDRAAQLDELTALASIFGDDLGGPQPRREAAARALGRGCSYDNGDDDAGSAVETSPRRVSVVPP